MSQLDAANQYPTIVIPSHNQLALLKNALNSLEAQTWPLDRLEVIVVDDGSKDGTADFLRSYSGKLQLRPVFHDEAKGRSGARNAGIKAATGDPIILLDGDMEVVPGFVQAHVETGGGEAVVIGRVRHHPDVRRSVLKHYYQARGAWKRNLDANIPGRYFLTLNASLPRWAVDKVGDLDENFRGYGGEDMDYGVRLQEAGVQFRISRDALSYHNHLRTLRDALNTVHNYGENNIPYLVRKHPTLFDELKLSFAAPLKNLHRKTVGLIARNLLVRFACWGIFYYPVRWISLMLEPFWIPSWVINYLIFRNYSRGYIAHLRSIDR
jgi:glycosyltransferase involved in cell wall biosynthesis